MRTHDLITRKLTEAFRPASLRVLDESHRHEGHAGHRPGGESHFRVYIVAQAFAGKSRLERHRLVNAALSAELAGGVRRVAREKRQYQAFTVEHGFMVASDRDQAAAAAVDAATSR